MKKSIAVLALLLASTPALAAPPSWTVVQEKSRIAFSGTHAGNAFEGNFGQWAARISFDPKDLAHSSANVAIAVATGATGDTFRDTTLKTEEWFNIAKFPRATFQTRRIVAQGGGYVAEGVLTLKDKAVPVRLPFTLKANGNLMQMQGSTTLDRVALGLGTKSDPGAKWVSKTITVTVSLLARKGS